MSDKNAKGFFNKFVKVFKQSVKEVKQSVEQSVKKQIEPIKKQIEQLKKQPRIASKEPPKKIKIRPKKLSEKGKKELLSRLEVAYKKEPSKKIKIRPKKTPESAKEDQFDDRKLTDNQHRILEKIDYEVNQTVHRDEKRNREYIKEIRDEQYNDKSKTLTELYSKYYDFFKKNPVVSRQSIYYDINFFIEILKYIIDDGTISCVERFNIYYKPIIHKNISRIQEKIKEKYNILKKDGLHLEPSKPLVEHLTIIDNFFNFLEENKSKIKGSELEKYVEIMKKLINNNRGILNHSIKPKEEPEIIELSKAFKGQNIR